MCITVCRTSMLDDPYAFCQYHCALGFGWCNYKSFKIITCHKVWDVPNKIVFRFYSSLCDFWCQIMSWISSKQPTLRILICFYLIFFLNMLVLSQHHAMQTHRSEHIILVKIIQCKAGFAWSCLEKSVTRYSLFLTNSDFVRCSIPYL